MAVNTQVTSRLWPMLLVLVLLLTGALALEVLARARGGEVQHIVIGAPAAGLGDEEGDRRVESDLPIKIVEKEPDSRATFVTFKGAGPRAWIKGQRYAVHFGYISSQRWRKNKLELMTSRTDLKELLADNAVKDCAAQEDGKFLETALEITAAAAAPQVINFTSRLSKDGIVSGIQAMLANQIPAGVMLCTQQLWWDLARLQANNIGDPATDRLWQNGVEKTELFGMRCITTIKNDIVDPNDLWIFAPEQYLGNFFLLQDATLFIKQEGPEIMFYVYEAPGIGFGNTKGIIRIRFNRAVA